MRAGFAFVKRKAHLNVKVIEILVPVGAQVQIGREGFVMIRMDELVAVITSGDWIVSLEYDGSNCKQYSVT